MALKKDYNRLNADQLFWFADNVVKACSPRPQFASILPELALLDTLNKALWETILTPQQHNSFSKKKMVAAKLYTIQQLDVVHEKVESICHGDVSLELLTGFNLILPRRKQRTAIDAVHITSALPLVSKGMIEIQLLHSIPRNFGYEVHYLLDGVDVNLGTHRLRDRSLKLRVGGFQSNVSVEVYVITMGPGTLRSRSSNKVRTTAL